MEKIQIWQYLKYKAEVANNIVLLINHNYYIRTLSCSFPPAGRQLLSLTECYSHAWFYASFTYICGHNQYRLLYDMFLIVHN